MRGRAWNLSLQNRVIDSTSCGLWIAPFDHKMEDFSRLPVEQSVHPNPDPSPSPNPNPNPIYFSRLPVEQSVQRLEGSYSSCQTDQIGRRR